MLISPHLVPMSPAETESQTMYGYLATVRDMEELDAAKKHVPR